MDEPLHSAEAFVKHVGAPAWHLRHIQSVLSTKQQQIETFVRLGWLRHRPYQHHPVVLGQFWGRKIHGGSTRLGWCW